MRLVLITDNFLPHAGGSRVYYYNIFKRIAAVGDDVTVLTKKTPGWAEFDKGESGGHFTIRRRFLPTGDLHYRQLPRLIPPIADAGLFAATHKVDVVHCGDVWPPGLAGILLNCAFRLPYIAYCHGEEVTVTERTRVQRHVRNLVYRRADAVIANGSFAVDNLRRIGIEDSKIHKVTPAVDIDRIFPEPRNEQLCRRYGISDQVVLMTIARLVPRKGQDAVIRVLRSLIRQYPKVKYIIAGRGPEETNLRKLVSESQLDGVVEFAGYVADAELNAHYNLADIIVMPNREDRIGSVEGFGMLFLEGNAAAKPVVAGRSGGAAEAMVDGETGLLVDGSDEGDLESALASLVGNTDLRRRFGAAGLKRVRESFTWGSRAAAVRDVSLSVLANQS